MPDITIGRLRGGFCVQWNDPETGKRRRYQLKARTREEAEPEARDRYIKECGLRTDPTTADLWGHYVTYLGTRPTATTMRATGKAILPHFGAMMPRHITDDDCLGYAAKRQAAGISVGSIHTELGHLRSCYTWAAKRRMIEYAPHVLRPPKPDSDVEPLSDAEARALIEGCHAPHIRLAVILMLTTAGRVGAILDLKWDRVDFDRGTINLRLADGVTRKGRAVLSMNPMSRAALEAAYHARLTEYVIEHGGGRVGCIRTGFKAALARAGIKRRVRIHDLRHTAAVKMLQAGVSMELVSQTLGHSNTEVTRRVYARFAPQDTAGAVVHLNFIDGPKRRA